MAPTPEDERWLSLATQASKEIDEKKLTILVKQLCSALDDRHKSRQSENEQNRTHLENTS